MSIWRTTPPTELDLPIWTINAGSDDVTLHKDSVPGSFIAWTKAYVPVAPASPYNTLFQTLADSPVSDHWCSSDWFYAGIEHGKSITSGCACKCSGDDKLLLG